MDGQGRTPIHLAFFDETGKENQSAQVIVTGAVFSESASLEFEERIWRWQKDKHRVSEFKLREILHRADRRKEELEFWSNILLESQFRWFAAAVGWQHKKLLADRGLTVELAAAILAVDQFAKHLEARGTLGTLAFDEQLAQTGFPRQLLAAKRTGKHSLSEVPTPHWGRILGQASYVPSNLLPEVWVADGFAFLLSLALRGRRFGSQLRSMWDVAKDKLWLGADGSAIPWAISVYPPDPRLEGSLLHHLGIVT